MNRQSPNRTGGFTLIELMFVTVLFLLLAGMSVSLFRRSYDALSSDFAAREVLDLMALARSRAIMERTAYGVHLKPEAHGFALVRSDERISGEPFARIPGRWGTLHPFPRGIELHGEEKVVVFYPDGTATAAEFKFVTRDRTLALSVDPVLGKGTVHEVS